jgi:hypothetical protein
MRVACGRPAHGRVNEKLCLHVDAAAVAIAIRIRRLDHWGCGPFADLLLLNGLACGLRGMQVRRGG